MALGGLTGRIKTNYDKLLFLLVLLGLLGSLAYLGLRVALMRSTVEEVVLRIDSMRPVSEKAAAADTNRYVKVEEEIANPFQLPIWTNSMLFVPERRVWCVECRRPIPFAATNCPLCFAKQPEPKKPPEDFDKDGMKDVWETEHGLNPRDPTDAGRDPDGDNFSNIEEYLDKTDPNDPKSCPDIVVKLRVKDIAVLALQLRFDGKIRVGDQKYKFQVNYGAGSNRRTYLVSLNEEVDKTGFVVKRYEEKKEKVKDATLGWMTKDNSVLYLERDGKEIPLKYRQAIPYREARAVLFLDVDSQDKKDFRVEVDATFDLKAERATEKYTVKAIDSDKQTVVITRASDGKRFTVTKPPVKEEGAGNVRK